MCDWSGIQSSRHSPPDWRAVSTRKHLLAPPADAQVVHDLVLDEPFGVDEEQPADRDLLPRLIDAVSLRDRAVEVAGQREIQPAQPPARPRGRDPSLVRLDRVAADPQEVAVLLRELLEPLAKPDQLGRADQREVAGIEDQDQPAAPVIRQRGPVAGRVREPGAGEVERWGGIADQGSLHRQISVPTVCYSGTCGSSRGSRRGPSQLATPGLDSA